MFIRASTVFFAAIALAGVAVAAPSELDARGIYRCDTLGSTPQCCNSFQPYDSPFVSDLWGYYEFPTPPSGMIGIQCYPLPPDGPRPVPLGLPVGGPGPVVIPCQGQPACCSSPFNGYSTDCVLL